MFNTNSYNPDVLTCLANLSNDEVFTPPKMVNEILDRLPQELFTNKHTTFLDPVSKSGVFQREIAKRLINGVEERIPDLQDRLNHIFMKQVFGIAITELTALLSRRSVYCSKKANGHYSVCDEFESDYGNIIYNRVEHTWINGKCSFCGASMENYARGNDRETHAYQFIHTKNAEEIFNMKFDVIIGNPPYQLSDGGFGKSATPIYQKFVQQAKKMNPRYLSMIIPSRWFGGGKGLNDFRSEMLNDDRIRVIVDYEDSSDIFPGVSVAGGICYFLWERDNRGICEIKNIQGNKESSSIRPLNEFRTFIRHSQAVPIIRKILSKNEVYMNKQVSSYRPFGLRTYVKPQKQGNIRLRWQKGEGPYQRSDITIGTEMIDKWKVISSRSGHEHAGNPDKDGKRRVLSVIDIIPPGTICTETYLVIGVYDSELEASNLVYYMKTRFLRFLLSQFMYSHSITKETYAFVPILDMNMKWTDESLYKRYNLLKDEIDFIESKIRVME